MIENELKIDVSSIVFSDLDNVDVSISDFKGKILILLSGEEKATRGCQEWIKTLNERCLSRNNIEIYGVAVILNLPWFIPKAFVKKKIRQVSEDLPLIDWSGESTEILKLKDLVTPHLFIIDQNGFLRYELASKPSEQRIEEVMQVIQKIENE